MLVLSRKKGEAIVIDNGITVTVVSICGKKGKKVSLGITAPKEIAVHRQELYDRIHGKSVEPAAVGEKALALAAP